jgi:RNA polymerase sigma factor (TIGR02999 family)
MTADITGLLEAWGQGDEAALDLLMSAMYPELRRIARRHLACRWPGQTLESAALANEAYLKLIRAGSLRVENRVHFLALCSQIIRRVLVDHARSRNIFWRCVRRLSDAFWWITLAAETTPSVAATRPKSL